LPSFGEARAKKNLAGVTAADVSRFRNKQIAEGLTPASANLAVKTLHTPFSAARKRGLILTSPAGAVKMLLAEAGERQTLRRGQVAALIGVVSQSERSLTLKGVLDRPDSFVILQIS
jgi:site-specific recombinase XerD